MLLTADAESDVLSTLDLEPVDVLKVSHHGSADPGLPRVLERCARASPRSRSGAHNTYGHPVAAHAARPCGAGAAVYRTDRDGTVRLEERGGAWWSRRMRSPAARR